MTPRPELWQTLVELATALAGPEDDQTPVQVTSFSLDLSLEVVAIQTQDGMQFYANLPRWRWQSGFDSRPARLKFVCSLAEASNGET